MKPREDSFSVYIHWPFCLKICPYCDFNVHLSKDVDIVLWRDSFRKELEHAKKLRSAGKVRTVFFGGGTPSLMPPSLVSDILEDLDRLWGVEKDIEVTLESNPIDLSFGRMSDFYSAGVTRLSLGVQSFDDKRLEFLGREHSAAGARRVYEDAVKVFDCVSFDLIYACPDQDIRKWEEELTYALRLSPKHISLYQLTLAEKTPFHRLYKKGKLSPLGEEQQVLFYNMTRDLCLDSGLKHYEISNFSREGYHCHHNILNWQGSDYVGVGAGAHGRLTIEGQRYATLGVAAPKKWLKSIQEKGHGLESCEALDCEQTQAELLFMGLRLTNGMSYQSIIEKGIKLNSNKRDFFIEQGLLEGNDKYLQVSARGQLVLDSLTMELLL